MVHKCVLLPIFEAQAIREAQEKEFLRKKNEVLRRRLGRKGRQMLRMHFLADSDALHLQEDDVAGDIDLAEETTLEAEPDMDLKDDDMMMSSLWAEDDCGESCAQHVSKEMESIPEMNTQAVSSLQSVPLEEWLLDAQRRTTYLCSHSTNTQGVPSPQSQPLAEWLLDAQIRTTILCSNSMEL